MSPTTHTEGAPRRAGDTAGAWQPAAASPLGAEARVLLLSTAGPDVDDELRSLLRGDLHWPTLLQLALHERAGPVLWRRLTALGLPGVDPATEDALRRNALVGGFRQQYLKGRLAAALDLLHGADHPVLLLKGAALGLTAYDAFDDRPMGDIDLLLPAGHVPDAYQLLLAAGWKRALPISRESFYDEHHHLTPLHDGRYRDSYLEVHSAMLPGWSPFFLSLDEVWAQARTVEWQGRTLRVPSVQHALLHLCIHFTWSHLAFRGTWRAFSDLHAMTARHDIDWAGFCEAARAARAGSCCYWALRLAANHGRVSIPADVLPALRPPGSDRLLQRLDNHFAANLLPGENACPSFRVFRHMWEAAIRPGWSGHGAIRPWDETPRAPHVAPPPALFGRVQAQLRRLAHWRRYVAAVMRR